jgi:hypothetical protein
MNSPRNNIFIALVPWVLFSFLAHHGSVKAGAGLALVASIAIAIPGIRAGRPKLLELGAVASFAAFTAVVFAVDPAAADTLGRYGRGIAAGLLALIAFGSLLWVPFTAQYARELVPESAWSSPAFMAVNRRLTAMWGAVFAAMVPLHIVAGSLDTQRANLIFNWALPALLVLWAIKRSDPETATPAVA